MKRLSIGLLGCAWVLALFCSFEKPSAGKVIAAGSPHWFTAHPKPATVLTPFYTPAASKKKFDISYYWYSYPSDTYVDYNTVANEEWELWVSLGGVEIDTNPIGGTLLEKGYLMFGHPHTVVYQFLYGHFLM